MNDDESGWNGSDEEGDVKVEIVRQPEIHWPRATEV